MKHYMIHKSTHLLVVLLVSILLASCSKETLFDNGGNEGEFVTLSVSMNDVGSVDFGVPQGSRNAVLPGDPGYTGNVTDTTLLDAVIFVFATDGSLINRQSFDSTQINRNDLRMQTTSGQRRIYAIGNALHKNDNFNDITSENALLNRMKTISRSEELERPLLFSGSISYMVQRDPSVVQQVIIPVTRMVSRIDIQYMVDDEIPALQNVRIDSVKAFNVPAAGLYFTAGSVSNANYITHRFVPGRSEQQSGRFVFYSFENSSINPTYIVVYASDEQGRQRSYTVSVGGNTISRNRWYKVNATISGF